MLSNVLIKRNGKLMVVREADAHPAERVDPAWTNSLAAIVRSIGTHYLPGVEGFDTLVRLRKHIISVAGGGKDAMHTPRIALGVYLILQGGATATQVLQMDAARLREYVRALHLHY